MDLATAKQALCDEVDRRKTLLLDVSHSIHAKPELNFNEHHAHEVLVGALRSEGLEVEPHAFGLDTAFRATAGSTGPTIAVFCEYDALPGIGHACGHNIIAAAGLGTGLAAAALADELGGRVVILGSPAEEGGGGKVVMAKAGALEGVDAAMMIHPADTDLRWMTTVAIRQLAVDYSGEAAHAAAHPWDGRNALDAAVLGYMNIAALRQHIRPDERLHGIFTNGGDKPNIVPSSSSMEWFVRAPTLALVDALGVRVIAALEAGALATGCEMAVRWIEPPYSDLVRNETLEDLFSENAAVFGRTMGTPGVDGSVVGSTDMGNISHLVPSIHPMLAVSPRGVGIHTEGFTAHAADEGGDRGVLDGAKAMAMTVADLWLNPESLAKCRADFERHTL